MPKTAAEVDALATQFGKTASAVFDNVEVRLFGSYLNGKPNDWSDIDLAIVSPDFEGIEHRLALKLLGKLRMNVSYDISPIPMTPDDFTNAPVGSIEYEVARNSRKIWPK